MKKTLLISLMILALSLAGIFYCVRLMQARSAFDQNWILDSSLPFINESEIKGRELVASFDMARMADELGEGAIDTWTSNPSDDTQICRIQAKKGNFDGGTGKSLAVMYDVESKIPANNGFWIHLKREDLRDFNALSFWARGDESIGFSTVIGIGLMDQHGRVVYHRIKGLKPTWHPYYIDLQKDQKFIDWAKVSRMRVIFKSTFVTRPKGKIYFDQIELLQLNRT